MTIRESGLLIAALMAIGGLTFFSGKRAPCLIKPPVGKHKPALIPDTNSVETEPHLPNSKSGPDATSAFSRDMAEPSTGD